MNGKKILALGLSALMIIGLVSGIMAIVKKTNKEVYIPAPNSSDIIENNSSNNDALPQEITFILSDTEYTVNKGTTWAEFIEGEDYNGNLIVSDGYIYLKDSFGVYLYNAQKERVVFETIIEAGYYTLEMFLIHFTIEGVTYTAENGTTWAEFIEGEDYNGNLVIQDGYIFVSQSMGAYLYSTAEYGYEKILATADIESKDYTPRWHYVSFTFGETAYRVERGTTWLEFIENNRTDESFANLYESDGNIYNSVSFYVLTYINGESYIAVSSSAVIDDLSYTLTNRSQLA